MGRDWIHGERSITWKWILRDFFFRIFFYISIPLLAIRFFSFKAESIGFLLPTTRQFVLALLLSFFSFALCLFFRGNSRKRIHLNPLRDFWFSTYLFLINSPSEEIFYRGFLFMFFSKFTGNPAFGLVLSSIIFGLQHFLFFGASPKNVLFDTFGGFFLGFCYIWLGKSLIPVIIIHGFSNLALFTVGSYVLRKWGWLKR